MAAGENERPRQKWRGFVLPDGETLAPHGEGLENVLAGALPLTDIGNYEAAASYLLAASSGTSVAPDLLRRRRRFRSWQAASEYHCEFIDDRHGSTGGAGDGASVGSCERCERQTIGWCPRDVHCHQRRWHTDWWK